MSYKYICIDMCIFIYIHTYIITYIITPIHIHIHNVYTYIHRCATPVFEMSTGRWSLLSISRCRSRSPTARKLFSTACITYVYIYIYREREMCVHIMCVCVQRVCIYIYI